MGLRELELFIDLAETLHFGRTGERLHLSASAVSRAIHRLEKQVGRRLLERDNRSVQLNDAGRVFLSYARQSVEEWHRVRARLNPQPAQLAGEVSLFCSVTAVYSLVAELLGRVRRRYSGIELILHTGDQADAIGRVQSGVEDLAIAARPQLLPNALQFLTLARSPLQFIAPLARSSDAAPLCADQCWETLPLIVSERGLARHHVDQWFRRRGVEPSIYAQVAGHEAIVPMVSLGLGVGVVPALVLDASPQRDTVQVVPAQPPLPMFEVGLCVREQRLEDPLVAAFWACAGDVGEAPDVL